MLSDIPISQLPPAATPLTGLELLPLVQNGVTLKAPAGAILGSAGTFVTASGVALAPGASYGFATDRAAYSATLPLLANLSLVGNATFPFVEVCDAAYNAGVNHITINASGSDQISLRGVASGSLVISISNTIVRFYATRNAGNSPYWLAIPFGS